MEGSGIYFYLFIIEMTKILSNSQMTSLSLSSLSSFFPPFSSLFPSFPPPSFQSSLFFPFNLRDKRERLRERDKSIHLILLPGLGQSEDETWNSIQVSHLDVQAPSVWTITCHFLGRILARKQNQEQSRAGTQTQGLLTTRPDVHPRVFSFIFSLGLALIFFHVSCSCTSQVWLGCRVVSEIHAFIFVCKWSCIF